MPSDILHWDAVGRINSQEKKVEWPWK